MLLLVLAAAGSTCASTAAGKKPLLADAPTETLALTLEPYFRELRVIRVLDGDIPLRLLVDTGGGATLITPEVAARRHCLPYGRDVGYRMTGERVEFPQCEELTVSAGQWRHSFKPVAVFDVNALLPPELPRLDGLLALDAFGGQVITIDWPNGRILVHRSRDAEDALQRHGLPIRLATGETGRMLSAFVPVAAGRRRPWFLLDSGNLRGTLVAQHVVRDGLLKLSSESTVALELVAGKSLTMPATVSDLTIDGALGTSFLMQGPVTLDLRVPVH